MLEYIGYSMTNFKKLGLQKLIVKKIVRLIIF